MLHELAYHLPHPITREPLNRGVSDKDLGTVLSQRLQAADVNCRDKSGNTALHIAARVASDTATDILLRLGADPNLSDAEGCTPLHLAARRTYWVLLVTFEPEEYAVWEGRAARIRRMLLAAGANAGLRNGEGQTAGGDGGGWEERDPRG